MKYSISEAARIAGITRKTFYKHIDKKPISVEKDDNGNKLIDASELIRVYGDKCKFEHNNVKGDAANSKHVSTGVSIEETVQNKILEKENELLKNHLELLKTQLKREGDLLDNATKALDKSLDNQKLIEDKSNKEDEWKIAFSELKNQVSNQEKAANEKLDLMVKEKTNVEKENKTYKVTGFILFVVAIAVTIYALIEQGVIQLN